MPNTFTIEGTLKNAKNVAIANKYIKFRIMSVGTDIEDNVTYPKETVEFQTDANGDFTGTLWVNGDSGVDCVYEIKLPNKGQRVQVVIPSAVAGSTVRLEDIIESYQVTASTQQSTVLDAALAYTNSLAADPSTNGNFSATEWRTDLGLVIGTNVQAYDAGLADLAGLTPANESIIKGNGTNWVAASNFKVNAGIDGTGFEVGDGASADGQSALALGESSTASGDYSSAIGFSTIASGVSSSAIGSSTTASGVAAYAGGVFSEASGDYTVSVGYDSLASGDYSSAAGRRAKAIHQGARVESDSQNADVSSTTTNQYTARFQNGYAFKGGQAVFEGGIETGNLAVTGDTVIATETPASASATGTAGQIAWDASYIYICTATNTWKRVAIATW